jgi:hypothetical protein
MPRSVACGGPLACLFDEARDIAVEFGGGDQGLAANIGDANNPPSG